MTKRQPIPGGPEDIAQVIELLKVTGLRTASESDARIAIKLRDTMAQMGKTAFQFTLLVADIGRAAQRGGTVDLSQMRLGGMVEKNISGQTVYVDPSLADFLNLFFQNRHFIL